MLYIIDFSSFELFVTEAFTKFVTSFPWESVADTPLIKSIFLPSFIISGSVSKVIFTDLAAATATVPSLSDLSKLSANNIVKITAITESTAITVTMDLIALFICSSQNP